MLLYYANPHVPLRACQAVVHVTPRRSDHSRFTSTSPILTKLLVCSPPPHLYSPVLPRISLSLVGRLPRVSTPSEKDLGGLERAPGGRDGPLALRWAPRLTILVL